jgi:hypothetical protein
MEQLFAGMRETLKGENGDRDAFGEAKRTVPFSFLHLGSRRRPPSGLRESCSFRRLDTSFETPGRVRSRTNWSEKVRQ